jgi:hypothetical protein
MTAPTFIAEASLCDHCLAAGVSAFPDNVLLPAATGCELYCYAACENVYGSAWRRCWRECTRACAAGPQGPA